MAQYLLGDTSARANDDPYQLILVGGFGGAPGTLLRVYDAEYSVFPNAMIGEFAAGPDASLLIELNRLEQIYLRGADGP